MSPDEILSALESKGIKLARKTLLNYEYANLINVPERGGLGQGKGRFTEYPEDTLEQIITAYYMLKDRNINPKKLGIIKHYGLKLAITRINGNISKEISEDYFFDDLKEIKEKIFTDITHREMLMLYKDVDCYAKIYMQNKQL